MNIYNEIKEEIKLFKKIIITGPQRSGTRIAANIISNDLLYKYIDEIDFNVTNFNKFSEIIKADNICVHCPALSDKILDFPEDVLIIFMRRDPSDIIKSQNRIGWGIKGKKLYSSGIREHNVYKKFKTYYNINTPISELKYKVWDNYQKHQVKNWIDLDYESLKQHNIWKTKTNRKSHEWNQIK